MHISSSFSFSSMSCTTFLQLFLKILNTFFRIQTNSVHIYTVYLNHQKELLSRADHLYTICLGKASFTVIYPAPTNNYPDSFGFPIYSKTLDLLGTGRFTGASLFALFIFESDHCQTLCRCGRPCGCAIFRL